MTGTLTQEEKLYITRLRPDTESHIKVDSNICLVCKDKACTKFCPANVFAWSSLDDELIIAYENCLECGACKIACSYGVIEYSNPEPGYGVC